MADFEQNIKGRTDILSTGSKYKKANTFSKQTFATFKQAVKKTAIQHAKKSATLSKKSTLKKLIKRAGLAGIAYTAYDIGKDFLKHYKDAKKTTTPVIKTDPMYTKGGPGQTKRKDVKPQSKYRGGGKIRNAFKEQYD